MWKDPVVEEIHAIRRKLAKACHNDIGEIVAHLQKRSREAGRTLVDLRPKGGATRAARAQHGRRRTA